jgi:hypothetical protein
MIGGFVTVFWGGDDDGIFDWLVEVDISNAGNIVMVVG